MTTARRTAAIALCFAAVLSLAACSGYGGGSGYSSGGASGGVSTVPAGGGSTTATSSTTAPSPMTISMQNYAFNPATLSVAVGDVVTIQNMDSVSHHVVIGTDDLGVQQPGQDVTWKAAKAGTFAMKCLIHPTMTGSITVK
jgi:plastocyanin